MCQNKISFAYCDLQNHTGNFNGTLSKVSASDLGAVAIKEVLNRANTNAADVDEVIIGQVNSFYLILIVFLCQKRDSNE